MMCQISEYSPAISAGARTCWFLRAAMHQRACQAVCEVFVRRRHSPRPAGSSVTVASGGHRTGERALYGEKAPSYVPGKNGAACAAPGRCRPGARQKARAPDGPRGQGRHTSLSVPVSACTHACVQRIHHHATHRRLCPTATAPCPCEMPPRLASRAPRAGWYYYGWKRQRCVSDIELFLPKFHVLACFMFYFGL
jgi:hypothetical protein